MLSCLEGSHSRKLYPWEYVNKKLMNMSEYMFVLNQASTNIHPIIPNLYTLIGNIPASAALFPCLDLKDAFYCLWLTTVSCSFLHFNGNTLSRVSKNNSHGLAFHWDLNSVPQSLERLSILT